RSASNWIRSLSVKGRINIGGFIAQVYQLEAQLHKNSCGDALGWIRTGAPVFGAFPVGPQTQDSITDGWRTQGLGAQADTTADRLGNLRWGVVLRASQYNLAPTQSKGVLGAQTPFEVVAFLIRQRANKNRWFHGHEHDTGAFFCTRPLLRLH